MGWASLNQGKMKVCRRETSFSEVSGGRMEALEAAAPGPDGFKEKTNTNTG